MGMPFLVKSFPPAGNIVGLWHGINGIDIFLSKLTMN
jgi:hypothetical protein